jgi:hypothetical protein
MASEETAKRHGKQRMLLFRGPSLYFRSKFPETRILTFGYDAYVADFQGVVSKNRIGDHARNFLYSVASYREKDETVSITKPFWYEAHASRTIARLSL